MHFNSDPRRRHSAELTVKVLAACNESMSRRFDLRGRTHARPERQSRAQVAQRLWRQVVDLRSRHRRRARCPAGLCRRRPCCLTLSPVRPDRAARTPQDGGRCCRRPCRSRAGRCCAHPRRAAPRPAVPERTLADLCCQRLDGVAARADRGSGQVNRIDRLWPTSLWTYPTFTDTGGLRCGASIWMRGARQSG